MSIFERFREKREDSRKQMLQARRQELFLRIQAAIARSLEIDSARIQPATRFKEDLGADSLSSLEIMMELEREFDLEIPDEEAEKIFTVEEAINYLEKNLKDLK